MTREAEIAALRAEVERLRLQVEALTAAAFPTGMTTPEEWRLSPDQRRIFCLLAGRERVSKEQVAQALWSFRPDCDRPDVRSIDVQMLRMRRKLEPFGVAIRTIRGDGYALEAEFRARWRNSFDNGGAACAAG